MENNHERSPSGHWGEQWAWPPGWTAKPSPMLSVERKKKRCPPHGPLLVDVPIEELYVARCLACGVSGPERLDSLKAKLAFDEYYQAT